MSSADVIIIGGGIWGLSTAYHLSRSHEASVVVLERNDSVASETTSQSAGQVGQLRADPLLVSGIGYTLNLLRRFKADTGHDPGYVQSGSLHLAMVAQRAAMFRRLAAQADKYGVPTRFLDRPQMAELAPLCSLAEVKLGLWVPNDGYVDARSCAIAYGQAAVDQGVQVMLGQQVQALSENGETICVETDRARHQTKHLVICAGPWTSRLARFLGVSPPMYPIRLQQARSAPCGVPPEHPVIRVPDESCYIRPERGGFLYGFFDPHPCPLDVHQKPADFRTADIEPEPSLVVESQRRLQKILPMLKSNRVDQYRQGMMTCTPDGKFVLGPDAALDRPNGPRVWLATGCGGTGIAASGAVGKWLSEWILCGAPKDDLSAYAPNRFGEQSRDLQWLSARACETSAAYYRLTNWQD